MAIPKQVQERVKEVVLRFNEKHFGGRKRDVEYIPRFGRKYLYLDRSDYGTVGPVCRLRYTGNFDKWEFAIFKYSSETYDPDEWMFPGSDHVDGTIEGAMLAGLEAYSV